MRFENMVSKKIENDSARRQALLDITRECQEGDDFSTNYLYKEAQVLMPLELLPPDILIEEDPEDDILKK
jgi:hypothetical protein